MHLADVFCKTATRQINERFKRVFRNDDTAVYQLAQRAMADELRWMEPESADA